MTQTSADYADIIPTCIVFRFPQNDLDIRAVCSYAYMYIVIFIVLNVKLKGQGKVFY